MSYRSKAQLRYMHAVHPGIARRWDQTYGSPGKLPEHVSDIKKHLVKKLARKMKHR